MDTDKLSLQWKKSAWLNSTQLYGELTDIIIKDTIFTRSFANIIDNSEVDSFSKNIVNIFTAANKTLPLIKDLIYNEFNTKVLAEGEGSILRGNSIVNKIEGAYVRLIGANYLRFVLSDLVTKVVLDTDLKLEIDPRKLNDYFEDGAIEYERKHQELELKENQTSLHQVAQMFLDRITDPVVVEEMPREIRAIADYTAESALRYAPESLAPLVGGFIMLRFFSPAIVTPEYSKLLSSEVVPSKRAKRNLVLLAKVLQNASNGVLFGGKEDFMTCMNSFITDNKEKMSSYFTLICKDPINTPTNKWIDLEGKPTTNVSTSTPTTVPPTAAAANPNSNPNGWSKPVLGGSKWLATTPSGTVSTPPIANNGSTALQSSSSSNKGGSMKSSGSSGNLAGSVSSSGGGSWDSYIKNIQISDLFDLHRIFDLYKEKIVSKLSTPGNGCIKTANRVTDILKELGPSPKTKNERKKKETDASEEPNTENNGSIGTALEDCTHMLERARFLFQGPNDKNDRSVFYLIVNRVKPEVFDNVNPLIAHIFKVMDPHTNSPYTLVVDMSWAHISNELKKAIFTHLPKLAEIFSRKYKKNIDKIFIVHPSAYTRAVVYFMSAFTSRKLKRKIHDIYNWKELTQYIEAENIALPETSKDFITKSYRVVKINSKGKKQERLIKFTSNSLLNIDPKTHRIQNEKRIDEIDEISSRIGSLQIHMRLSDSSSCTFGKNQSLTNRIGFLSLGGGGSSNNSVNHSNKDKDKLGDSTSRKYVCNDELERDHILQDIFETGFKMGLSSRSAKSLPTEYKVIKVNNVGKHQERIFKLTIDSLLNLDQQRIKSENSFAGIEEVTLDKDEDDVVWIKFKSESNKRKIICNKGEGKQLHYVLTDAINKYQTTIDIQEGALKLDAEEGSY
ncbi:hypothetical protein DICPUDRAFT_79326 [Dictyostelium purpureum]|uniref:Ras-GAP domain-containing protein n=1 Tax=Dictyostelium purpureum TaxID=5786 RepID=F0ZM90_DICPU|nr:uncharacterized protein DICPUDRAFT_79326 [Dictyostelium purpureum]EGC34955.1 hypothetical protein DICPUDRAFT_79326 [Dictyostelium purpureum]|eukprot:XP_003288536.1 hypothetical protein DICPUDRAFT_79326 [Dictyostelium purpureum]